MALTAVYEHGVFRPEQPLELAEGTRVELIVVPIPISDGEQTPAEILAEIAAMPVQNSDNELAGGDHDAILYGEDGAR